MSAPVLPLAWVPTIGGLVCDHEGGRVASSPEHRSVWPSESPDHGITRFADGGWMVTLPMGTGSARTLPKALKAARVEQHEALRAERELGIADATAEHYEARARRLGAVTLEGEDLVLLREPATDDGPVGCEYHDTEPSLFCGACREALRRHGASDDESEVSS